MRLAVLNVVGLSESLLGPHTPGLSAFARKHGIQSHEPEFPAVTCVAQSSIVTGTPPAGHGIVGNGWYDRESAEVRFWKQSNHLVRGDKLWDKLRRQIPGFTCAKLFWWYNMHANVDFSITPRPLYPADGRKVFDIHTQPMGLRDELKRDLGAFPFPSFWGPAAGIASSEWIAASAKWVEEKHAPTLSLVYLPHLDYPLQKDGPDAPNIPDELRRIDHVATGLIDYYESRGVRVMILSEYGIGPVSRPVHLNRLFRAKGWLSLKNELGRETLDCGGCRVFAGVDELRAPRDIWGEGVASERAGDFIAVAEQDAWFTYYFWDDDALAPDYARTIDIHRKPGYDPCELFIDPALRLPKLQIAGFLLKKKLGLRGLLEVIPLDAALVRGSHGRDRVADGLRPVLIGAGHPVKCAADAHHAILKALLRG